MVGDKIIESLKWRYATKKFDSSKIIPRDEFNILLESLRLAPSSFGLQPWKFLIIENKKLRENIKDFAWGQPQIVDASHLVVLCVKNSITDSEIKEFVRFSAEERGVSLESLKDYENLILSFVKGLNNKDILEWNKKQAYIAAGFLMETAALMRIDSCPMEGFDNSKIDEILKLKEKSLSSTLIIPLGYRSQSDKYSLLKKIRYSKEDLFEFIK